MRAWLRALAVMLLSGCQCFVPVDDDAGLELDAGGGDGGAVIDGGVDDGSCLSSVRRFRSTRFASLP